MLKENKNKLIKILNSMINIYGNNNVVRKSINNCLQEKNIPLSYGSRIIGGKLDLLTFDFDKNENLFIIYEFTKAFQLGIKQIDNITMNQIGTQEDIINLNVINFFTKVEIEKFESITRLSTQQVKTYPYIFKNMLKVSNNHYTGIITARQLAEMDKTNDIQYNFNTQRDAKIDEFGMKKININQQKIEEIKNNLLQGTQFSDEIKINIVQDELANIEFVSDDGIVGTLIVHNGIMNIFDGYHRKTANSLALIENPNLNFNWKFTITNYTENKAKDFMVQINKQTPMKKEYIKNININLLENVIVDYINDNNLSIMHNQIKNDIMELKFGGYTRKSIMANAIKDCFGNDINKINIKQIADFISQQMNVVSKYFNLNNFSTNQNMFYLYVKLISKLYYNQISIEEFNNILNNINFDDSLWLEFNLNNNNISRAAKNKLYQIVDNMCAEVSNESK